MAQLNLDLNDLTNSALKRLVTQLLAAKDGDEKDILNSLKQKRGSAKNDLADLHEEMHGKPNTPEVEEEPDPFDTDKAEEASEKKRKKK